MRAVDCVRFEGESKSPHEASQLDDARAAYAAAFDAFARLALAYFENPSTELREACEAAALVLRAVERTG